MKHRKKRAGSYSDGYVPAGMVAWCALHNRGMNGKYMRVKHCIRRGGTCPHLRWPAPAEQRYLEGR